MKVRLPISLGAKASSPLAPQPSKRKWLFGANAVILTIAVIAIVVLVNIILHQHPYRIDVTRTKEYSLSEQTKSILANLDQEVKLTAFLISGESRLTRDLIEEYRLASPKVQVEIVDPIANPDKAREYNITSAGTVVFESGNKTEVVKSSDMYDYSSTSYYDYYQTPDFIGEQAFTSAIVKVTSRTTQKIYFTSGHKELSLSSDLTEVRDRLSNEGYEVAELALAIKGEVPDDTSLLFIAGPTRDLTEAEVNAIDDYLRRGGRLIACIDSPISQEEQLVNVAALLERWGIELHEDLVIDPERFMIPEVAWVVPNLGHHAITNPLRNASLPVVLPYSRSLNTLSRAGDHLNISTLLTTSRSAWGETNLQAGSNISADDNDFQGPLTLGVVVTASIESSDEAEDMSTETGETRIVAIGDSSFMSNSYLGLGNLDLILNAVNWAVGAETLVSIRPKTIDLETLYMTNDQFRSVFYSTVVVIPALVLISGIAIYLRRRHL